MTASTGDTPGRIFISYRREETAYPAGWLFDRLTSHFGTDQIFKDVDSIELGDDFVEVITSAVGSCDVLLALIGDRWLAITNPDGQRRLDDPDDFVRLEIEAALARNVRVIPILVDGARMPRANELPASLAKLVRRQALELSPSRFGSDTQRLLRVLDRTIAEAREQTRREAEKASAERQRRVGQLQREVHEHAEAEDWQAVVAASDELAALDPAAADPDGLASAAREQITRRREAEKASAERQRRVGQLQREVHEHAEAEDWQAVVAASDELAALDPAAADPDGLASAAREQITRRREAEKAAAERQRRESRDGVKASEPTPGETSAAESAGGPGAIPSTASQPLAESGAVTHAVQEEAGTQIEEGITPAATVPRNDTGRRGPSSSPAAPEAGPSWRPSRRVVLAFAGVGVFAGGIVAAVLLAGAPGSRSPGLGLQSPSLGAHQSESPRAHVSSSPPAYQITTTLTDPRTGSEGIHALAFSPPGQIVATGDDNGKTYLWNVATGAQTATLSDSGRGGVWSLAFSPGGKTLATGDGNGKISLWIVATGRRLATLPGPSGNAAYGGYVAYGVAFSPDGKTLAAGYQNGTAYLWNLATRSPRTILTAPTSTTSIDAIAFSPDGKTLATAAYDNLASTDTTYLWDVATGSQTAALTDPSHGKAISGVAFSPNGKTLAVGNSSGSTYLWAVASGHLKATLPCPSYQPGAGGLAFSPDGKTLATGASNDTTICLWGVTTHQQVTTLTDPSSGIQGVAFSPNGKLLATGDYNGSAYLRNVP